MMTGVWLSNSLEEGTSSWAPGHRECGSPPKDRAAQARNERQLGVVEVLKESEQEDKKERLKPAPGSCVGQLQFLT